MAIGIALVETAEATPSPLMPKNLCGCRAALIELIAGVTEPSVAFLNPSGIDKPEAICRCVCDSVVRAPTATSKSNRRCIAA